MTKNKILTVGALAASMLTSHAALTWTGAADGVSLYNEGNWLEDDGSAVEAGEIDNDAPITADTGGLILISTGTGTPSAFGGDFELGAGNALEVSGGKTLASTGNSAIFGNNVAATLSGASTVNVQYIVNLNWTISGGSTLTLRGGNTPLDNTTVNLLDTSSQVVFLDEDTTAFTNEHLSKFTVNGAAAVIGTNLSVTSDGGSGVVVQAIPEPCSTALLGLGGLALILRRRK